MSPNPIQKQTTKKSEGEFTTKGSKANDTPKRGEEVVKGLDDGNADAMEVDSDPKDKEKSKDDDEDSLKQYAESESDEDMVMEDRAKEYEPLGSEISSGKIGPNTPNYVVRSYCQQEADKCDRQVKAAIAAGDDKSFDELSKQKERWLLKKQHFLEDDGVGPSSCKGKSQGKKALKDIVHLPTFKKDVPPLQIQGETKKRDRHDKRHPLYASVDDFFEDFETYLHVNEVPREDHWEQCIFFTCAPGKRSWLASIIKRAKDNTYEGFKVELRTDLSSPYAELYHLMHIRFMQQKKTKLSLRQFALAINQYAQRHHISDDKSLLMDFVCNVADQFRKPIWDVVMKFHEGHDRLPSMSEMVKLAGTVEDANKMSRASDQSKPWAEVENDVDDDHSYSESGSDNSDDEEPTRKRKRNNKSKGNKKANAKKGKGKGKDKGKQKALYCRIHKQGDHDTDHCFSVVKLANSKHGVQQQPKRARLCDFCHEVPYFKGHSCTPMLEYNAKKDAEAKQQHKKVMARFAALKYLGKEHNEIDVDELMGSSRKQCKNDIWVRATQKEKTDECLLIPIMIQNLEIMALLDTGCTHSLVNKNFVVTNNLEITPTDGSIHLAADGLTVPRTGSIKDVNVEYSDKEFSHSFEVMELPDPEIPVYLGMDILSKMGIGFTGAMDSTVIDPEPYEPNNSPAGTNEQRDAFFKKIDPLILDNKRIPKTSFCTLPESVITLDTGDHPPVYKRQYPIPIALEPVLQETIDQWLEDGTVEPATINSSWNSPLTFAPKKDAYGNHTGKRPCLDPRHINCLIADDRHPLHLIRDIFHGLNGASVFTTLDLKSAFHR